MPLIDLSAATKTIVKLLQVGLDPTTTGTPEVTAIPPDEVESQGANKVSVHLLHITESAEFRNFPPGPRQRNSPIQQLPMGLVLQYVISIARESLTGGGSDSTHLEALAAQTLLGRIARLLHDFPIITPQTQIAGQFILHSDFAEDKENLELILRPASLEENLNFWATQNQKLARACLFLEARIAVLQPQAPEILPGIVLSVGNFVFPSAGPQLFNTKNSLRFKPPNLPDFVTANATPARVAIFPDDDTLDAEPFVDNDLLTIEASGLSPGKRILQLRIGAQTFSVDLDDAPTENDNWAFAIGSTTIQLRFRTRVLARVGSAPLPSIVRLAPGIYGVRLMLEDTRLGPTARPRTSNEVAFAVIPQILSVAPTALPIDDPATNDYTLLIAGRYLVEPPGSPDTPGFPSAEVVDPPPGAPPPTVFVPTVPDIELIVNGQVLTRVNDDGVTWIDGTYFIQEQPPYAPGATPVDIIRFKLADPTNPNNIPSISPIFHPLPVQLYVNGASATPAWLTVRAT